MARRRRGLGLGTMLKGAALGAAAMYFYDPGDGRRRRALLRDRAIRTVHETTEEIERRQRHLFNRSHGLLSRFWARLRPEEVSNEVLEERVRAALGHASEAASSIETKVEDGRVELKGTVSPHEHMRIVREVKHVPGVKSIDDDLHDQPAAPSS
jgi:BON domain